MTFVQFHLQQNVFEQVLKNSSYWVEFLSMSFITLHFYTIIFKREDYHRLLNLCQDIWSQLRENERSNIMIFESKLRLAHKIFLVSSVMSMFIFPGAAIYLNSTDNSGIRRMPFQ